MTAALGLAAGQSFSRPSNLFQRDFVIAVGPTLIQSRAPPAEPGKPDYSDTLRCTFKVERDLNRDPNVAEVEVYNLNREHRNALQSRRDLTISAGYVGSLQLLFFGSIGFVAHYREGVNWVTKIRCGDGVLQYSTAEVNTTISGTVSIQDLIQTLVSSLDLELGNGAIRFRVDIPRAVNLSNRGTTISGTAASVLDRFVTSAGLQWSIQEGKLQILAPRETLPQNVIAVKIISKDTGLIGTPEVNSVTGFVTGKTLLQGDMIPGRAIIIRTDTIDGSFGLQRVVHIGDTWGTDWYSEFEAYPVG